MKLLEMIRSAAAAAAGAFGAALIAASSCVLAAPTSDSDVIRPFRIEVPQGDLVDLRKRLEATRWPSEELVDDRSQAFPVCAR